jgi:hypothetical protein
MERETAKLENLPNSQPQIKTYHCVCSTLLFATTHVLSDLPRRAEPALDKAYILPLPPASRLAGETAEEDDAEPQIRVGSGVGYSLLLSTTQDRKPTIVRREDGFERRVLLRCGRCKLVVGYKLDEAQFRPAEGGTSGAGVGEGGEETVNGMDEVQVVYLLPGGLVSSEDLKNGKTPEVVEWRQWDTKVA